MKLIRRILADILQLARSTLKTIKRAGGTTQIVCEGRPDISKQDHLNNVIKIIGLCVCDKCALKENLKTHTGKKGEIRLVCSRCGSSDWHMSTSGTMGG